MAVRPIVRFPDPRLQATAVPVVAFDAALAALAEDLVDTMRAAPGIGIAAPHIGVPLRLVVIELDDASGVQVYVNPAITWHSPELRRHREGSVSMPGVTGEVERPEKVHLRYQDLAGGEHSGEASGLLSVCLQHEIDQLDGIFWIEKLSRLKRDRSIKRFAKLQT